MNEMRKLIETIEQIDEDPTVGGRMRAIANDLTDIIKTAEQMQIDFEKYPDIEKYKILAMVIEDECDRLRNRIYSSL